MFEPRIKKMNWVLITLLGGNIVGITLAPFGIYIRESKINNITIINHEKIHWQQQLEMLFIFFYIWYVLEFIIRLFINGSNAYRLLFFEQEAYDNERNLKYLKSRKFFAWLR